MQITGGISHMHSHDTHNKTLASGAHVASASVLEVVRCGSAVMWPRSWPRGSWLLDDGSSDGRAESGEARGCRASGDA